MSTKSYSLKRVEKLLITFLLLIILMNGLILLSILKNWIKKMFKDDLLKDKNILVTGGGTGLGKEMASHYAKHGANIFICGRRENVLKETANEITDKYGTSVS